MESALESAGRHASSSGRSAGAHTGSQEAVQHQQSGGFALGQKEGQPLSMYFAQRKLLVNSSDSFRVFCAALTLLQVCFGLNVYFSNDE